MLDLIGAGGGSSRGSSPTRTKDTLISQDYFEIVLGLSEGPIKGLVQGQRNAAENFFIGDTPLNNPGRDEPNFPDFVLTHLMGYESDPSIKFNLGGQSSNSAVGVRLAQNIPVVRQTSQAQRGNFSRLEIRIMFNQLVEINDNGEFEAEARFQIAYKKTKSPTWLFFEPETVIRGKTTSGAVKDFVIDLPANPDDDWDIRLLKISSDNNGDKGVLTDFTWESFQCVSLDPIKWKDLATVQIYGRASNQFSSIPDFSGIYDGMLVQVPTNYNPETRTYDESTPWNGSLKLAFTNNPAWILYALCTNQRWGLPRYYLTVSTNRYEFYNAGKWCDQGVNVPGTSIYQPRFTFNEVFQDAKQGMEALQYIAGSFNSVILDDGTGTIILRTDQPRTPKLIFTPETVEQGEFNYTFTDIATRYNDISVVFINPDLDWNEDRRKATIDNTTEIAANGRIPTEFVAVGCTDVHEAVRRANYHYLTATTEKATVSFTTTRMGMFVEPFETIYVADPLSGWGKPGRIKSISNGRVYLRDPIYFPDTSVQQFSLQCYEGLRTFGVAPPAAGANYFLNIVSGTIPLVSEYPDRAVFTLENTDLLGRAKPFKVLSISEVDGSADKFQITALEINVNKYPDADIGAQSESVKYSFTMPGEPILPPVLNLESGVGQLVTNTDGTIVPRIYASWLRPLNAFTDHYEIDYRELGESNWTTISNIYGDSAYISPVKDNTRYNVRLYAVTPLGRRSVKFLEVLNYLSSAKIQKLENVSGMEIYAVENGYKVFWKAPSFPDYSATETRLGFSIQPWESLSVFTRGKVDQIFFGYMTAGEYRLYAKHMDTSGNYSAGANYVPLVILLPAPMVVTDETSGNTPQFSWENPTTTQPVRFYRVKRGPTYVGAVTIAEVTDLRFAHVEKQAGAYRYWFEAVDYANNVGPAVSLLILVLPGISEGLAILRQDVQASVAALLDINQGVSDRILEEARVRGTDITETQRLIKVGDDQLAEKITLLTAKNAGYTRGNLIPNGGGENGLVDWTGDLTGFQAIPSVWGQLVHRFGVLTAGTIFTPTLIVQEGEYYTVSYDTKFFSNQNTCWVGIHFYNAAGALVGQPVLGSSFGNHDFSNDPDRRQTRSFEALAPSGAISAKVSFNWGLMSAGSTTGIRMVKAERGRLPSTAYTTEMTTVGALSAIQQEASVRASAISAEAALRNTLAIALDKTTVSLNEEKIVRADQTGALLSRWGLNVIAGNKVAGISLNNDGVTTMFTVLADKFAFAQTGDQPGQYKYPFIVGTVAGISTIGLSGLLLVDGTVKTRALEAESVTADKVKAKSLTAQQLAAGSVTADIINVGASLNLLNNSTFTSRVGSQGQPLNWSTYHNLEGNVITFGSNFTSQYNLTEGVTGYISQQGANYSGFNAYDRNAQVYSDFVPVKYGDRVEASVYVATHRCQAGVVIQFFDYLNNLLQSSGSDPIEFPQTNGIVIGDYFRIFHFASAPVNAARMRLVVVKSATTPGNQDSYFFYTRPLLGLATLNQTAVSPWTATGLITRITPEGIVTPSLGAFSANLGEVYAGRLEINGDIVGGNGWGYIRSPGKWLDGNWGWVMARHSNGDQFIDFTQNGMKFVMTQLGGVSKASMDWGGFYVDSDGNMTIRSLNVVGTGNIIPGASSATYFASADNQVENVGVHNGNITVYNVSSGGGSLVITLNCLMGIDAAFVSEGGD